MKKIVAIIGSARKKATYKAVQEFERSLKEFNKSKMEFEFEFEYVFLHNYNLELCRGCLSCLNKGEETCPLKDDHGLLLEKLEKTDAVIFASPNYAFHVSARMKNFFDRFAYFFHRPHFFGKVCTAIVSQGVYGGNKIRKYLESMGKNFGFTTTKGMVVTTFDPMTESQLNILKKKSSKAAKRFFKKLKRPKYAKPNLFRLMMFRISRNMIKNLDKKYRDHQYFKEQGWFESDYYYDVSLGIGKKIAGNFFDYMGRKMAKHQ